MIDKIIRGLIIFNIINLIFSYIYLPILSHFIHGKDLLMLSGFYVSLILSVIDLVLLVFLKKDRKKLLVFTFLNVTTAILTSLFFIYYYSHYI